MKVAILSESPADEAAYRVLVEAVLESETTSAELSLRSRGWPSVFTTLPTVVKQLHYHTDADGLVVVVDSNHSPVHLAAHENESGYLETCRLCRLRKMAHETLRNCRPVAGRLALQIAVGLAVPAIEAWLLCGVRPEVSEAAWGNGLEEGRDPYSKRELKQRAGTDRAPMAVLKERMTGHARRLAEDVSQLERAFPGGFGALARSLRAWPRV